MASTITIAGVQMDVKFGETETNLSAVISAIEEAAQQQAKLIVFPECALTGYCFDSLEEGLPCAEEVPGPSTEKLTAVCAKLDVHCVVGMLERDGDRLFNACVLVGPQGVVGCYRKIHMPGLGIDLCATPGDQLPTVFACGDLKIGMSICYDSSFPEVSRSMALDGADLIVLPTNWPAAAEIFAEHAINTRALENHVYYMSVDRIGTERGFHFIGCSRICDPTGKTLSEAKHDGPAIIYAEIDPEFARQKHLVRVPGKHEIHRFRDRRPEMYARLIDPVQ